MASGLKIGELYALLSLDKAGFETGVAESKGLFSSLGGLATSAMLGVGAALIGAGIAAFDMGAKYEDATNILIQKTGASGTALQGMQTIMTNVAGKVPQSLTQVATAVSIVNDRLHLTGPAAQVASQQVLDFARITGMDTTTAANGAADALARMGLSSDQLGPLLDKVTMASQKTGTSASDLLTGLTKVGPAMQDMGFSVDQSTALLAAWSAAGGDTTQVGTAMNKALALMAKQGVTDANTAMTDLFNQIKDAPDAMTATGIATAAFGTKVGVTMAQQIRSGTLDVDALSASLSNSQGTMEDTAQRSLSLGDRISMGFNSMTAKVGQSMQAVMPQLGDLVQGGFDLVGNAIDWIVKNVLPPLIDGFKWLSDTVIPAVQTALQPLFDAFTKVGNAVSGVAGGGGPLDLLKGALDWLTNNVFPLFTAGIAGWQTIFDGISTGLDGFAKGLQPGLSDAMSFLNDKVLPPLQDGLNWLSTSVIPTIATALSGLAQDVLPVLGAALGWLLDNVLTPLGNFIMDTLVNIVFPAFRDALNFINDKVLPPIRDALDWISKNILPPLGAAFDYLTTTVLPAFQSILQNLMDNVISPLWNNILQPLAKFLTDTLGAAFDWLAKNVLPALQTAFNDIVTVVKDLWENWLKPWIDWISKNLIPPIRDTLNTVLGALKTAWDDISGAVQTLWQNWLKPLVDFISNTLVPPIRDGLNFVLGLLQTAFNDVHDAVQAVIDIFHTIVDFISNTFNGVLGTLQSAIGDVTQSFKDGQKEGHDWALEIKNGKQPTMDLIGVLLGGPEAWMKFAGAANESTKETTHGLDLMGLASGTFSDVLSGNFNDIGNTLTKNGLDWNTLQTKIGNVFSGIQSSIGNAVSNVRTALSSMFDPIVNSINDAIQHVRDAWNAFARGWNGVSINIPSITIPNPLGGNFTVGGGQLNLPNLPMFAAGGDVMRDMLARVNEVGPELAFLPRGTHMFSALDTRNMLGDKGGDRPLIGEQNIYGLQPDEVERQTTRAMRRMALEWSLS